MVDNPIDGWFARLIENDCQLWEIARGRAVRMGIAAPEHGLGSYFEAKPDETIWDAIRRETPWLDGQANPGPFVPLSCTPGQFFPRMARPIIGYDFDIARLPNGETEHRYLRSAQTQLEALVANLDAICRVVEPTRLTLGVHGHEIRNLLILAATEAEMHMAGIMVSNGNQSKTLNTTSYVKLADPLKLRCYSVRFQRYPDVPKIVPFSAWNVREPTQSLGWYVAYNAVKHDRECQFQRASLDNAFIAVAACTVMLVAQCGGAALSDNLGRSLVVEAPTWPLADFYVTPQHCSEWTPTNHHALI